MSLPALLPRESIRLRLEAIFPEGTPNRSYCIRELAASVVFTALYVGAIDGAGIFIGPKHVYRMGNQQAGLTANDDRLEYAAGVKRPGYAGKGSSWYRDNTREPIRDETLRDGLVPQGAFLERTDLPTTSSKPRYSLQAAFAALFDPALKDHPLADAIEKWRAQHLDAGTLARIALVRRGAASGGDYVLVTFPNGETRRLKPGPSSEITKAVIEMFAPAFLGAPAVVFISESGNKVVQRDDDLARRIKLNIKADKDLPDAVLVDLKPQHPLLVFVEVVATDGPINERRKKALEKLAEDAGFGVKNLAFVTAYLDRSGSPFKKTVDVLAWGSYAWFVSEPKGLLKLSQEQTLG